MNLAEPLASGRRLPGQGSEMPITVRFSWLLGATLKALLSLLARPRSMVVPWLGPSFLVAYSTAFEIALACPCMTHGCHERDRLSSPQKASNRFVPLGLHPSGYRKVKIDANGCMNPREVRQVAERNLFFLHLNLWRRTHPFTHTTRSCYVVKRFVVHTEFERNAGHDVANLAERVG